MTKRGTAPENRRQRANRTKLQSKNQSLLVTKGSESGRESGKRAARVSCCLATVRTRARPIVERVRPARREQSSPKESPEERTSGTHKISSSCRRGNRIENFLKSVQMASNMSNIMTDYSPLRASTAQDQSLTVLTVLAPSNNQDQPLTVLTGAFF